MKLALKNHFQGQILVQRPVGIWGHSKDYEILKLITFFFIFGTGPLENFQNTFSFFSVSDYFESNPPVITLAISWCNVDFFVGYFFFNFFC